MNCDEMNEVMGDEKGKWATATYISQVDEPKPARH